MEDQGFMNQWMVSLYGDLSAMSMAEAAYPEDDIGDSFMYDNYQPLHFEPTTTVVDELNPSSWTSRINVPIPSPEPYNCFSVNNQVAAAGSYFYSAPANPTRVCSNNDLIDQENGYSDHMLFDHPPVWNDEKSDALIRGQEAKKGKSSTMSEATRTLGAQDHVNAERRRRQMLSEKFIELSAVVPGLKKIDKASVLADATKYIKQLEGRVKDLEDQTKSKTIESVHLVKKSHIVIDDTNNGFSSETFIQGTPDETQPEIEARVCAENVLIRVHCVKQKGAIEKIIAEVEKLHLTIVNTSVLAFGASALNITLVAQMEAGCWMTVNDLVKALYAPLKSFL